MLEPIRSAMTKYHAEQVCVRAAVFPLLSVSSVQCVDVRAQAAGGTPKGWTTDPVTASVMAVRVSLHAVFTHLPLCIACVRLPGVAERSVNVRPPHSLGLFVRLVPRTHVIAGGGLSARVRVGVFLVLCAPAHVCGQLHVPLQGKSSPGAAAHGRRGGAPCPRRSCLHTCTVC